MKNTSFKRSLKELQRELRKVTGERDKHSEKAEELGNSVRAQRLFVAEKQREVNEAAVAGRGLYKLEEKLKKSQKKLENLEGKLRDAGEKRDKAEQALVQLRKDEKKAEQDESGE